MNILLKIQGCGILMERFRNGTEGSTKRPRQKQNLNGMPLFQSFSMK